VTSVTRTQASSPTRTLASILTLAVTTNSLIGWERENSQVAPSALRNPDELATAHRIIVKVGSSTLTGPDGNLDLPDTESDRRCDR
jgi:hypothetical protein